MDLSTLGQNTVRECENFATEGQTGMELVTGPFGQCGSKMIRRREIGILEWDLIDSCDSVCEGSCVLSIFQVHS